MSDISYVVMEPAPEVPDALKEKLLHVRTVLGPRIEALMGNRDLNPGGLEIDLRLDFVRGVAAIVSFDPKTKTGGRLEISRCEIEGDAWETRAMLRALRLVEPLVTA